MKYNFDEILDAFEFVSFADPYEHQAYLDKETGKIYFESEFAENFEELPDDIDSDRYVEIPHKNELELGRRLALQFTAENLPDQLGTVEAIFDSKGAYARFKSLLEERNLLPQWHNYENAAHGRELRAWCAANGLKLA